MEIKNVEQGTSEWFNARKGKMTASHATAIGNNGKGLDTYITEIMSEYYSSAEREQFSNEHTDRGNEYEATARGIYEFENDVTVEQVGFIEYDEYTGCSPDGLVGEEGGIEIKCVSDSKYFRFLLNGESEIDNGHIWQIQMNLLITGRKWWDLVMYNPNFKRSTCVYRTTPDEEKFEALKKGLEKGKAKILEIKKQIDEAI